MDQIELLALLDKTDRELDAFPFWASFKRACSEYPIKEVDNLTPGRQALLILWEATVQRKNNRGEIISINLEDGDTVEKIEKLKADLISNFISTDIDQKALKKFFSSIKKNI
tara:strand:+ start:2979 stop:3314 length:336 start_codon:yes stop_codon:yes gene_type:complete